MQIDQITINLRPRSTWEAVDLGFGMARVWWPTLFFCWIVLALPVFVIAFVVFYDNPLVASTIFWWFKPMYEQLPLHFISRAIFKDEPDKKQMLKQLFRIASRQIFANLTWRRFSFNRSYTAPVAQLEGLSGTRRRERINVLSETRNVGAKLTIVCLHLEAVIYSSLIVLAWMFVPAELDLTEWVNENENTTNILLNIFYFIGVAVIAPFYVVSGFSLYLNRRTHLEGWDIELAFKRIKERLSKTKVVAMTATVLLSIGFIFGGILFSPEVSADTGIESVIPKKETQSDDSSPQAITGLITKDHAKRLIEEVLDRDEFGKKKKVKTWRLKEKFNNELEEEKDDLDLSFMGQLVALLADVGYFLMWAGLALLIIFVIYQFPRWKAALDMGGRSPKVKRKPAPDVLFGLEIAKESLPDDVAAEAWKLFSERKPRQALSLLYRGSLSVLVDRFGLIVRESDTEGECAEKVKLHHTQASEFFSTLTKVWVFMAYGHEMPTSEQMQILCNDWNKFFGEKPI